MSSQLKNRLVGATVLVGMFAISWPFIFDETPQYPVDTHSQIPSAPQFQRFEVAPAQQPDREISQSMITAQQNLAATQADINAKASAPASSAAASRDERSDKEGSKSSAYKLVENPALVADNTANKAVAKATKSTEEKAVRVSKPVATAVAPSKSNNKSNKKTTAKIAKSAKKNLPKLLSTRPNLGSDGLPVSWTIQIASFRDKANAVKLRERLVSEGFSSYIKPNPGVNAEILRVFVGPEVDKLRARTIQKSIEQKLKLKTLLLRYSN